MTTLTLWDHAFALTVFLVFPVYSRMTIAAVLDTIRSGGEAARVDAYQQVIASWVGFAACVGVLWVFFDRSWALVGIRTSSDFQLIVASIVAVAVIALVVVPIRQIANNPDRHGELESQMGDVALFMPQSHREERWFKGVSFNAGVTEELIFRGYLIWYLQHFVSTAWAAVIAVLAFGLAHWYQGAKQLPGILFVSGVAVSLYVYTGSLLVPVLFHIALDAMQGHYIARILRSEAQVA
jgi:membrane protease YdiL (CAAX protease family)